MIILADLEAFLEPLGAILEPLGGSWGDLGASWGVLEAPRRPPWRENGPGSSGSKIFRGPLGTHLGLPGGRQGGRTGSRSARGARGERAAGAFRDPPPSQSFS